MDGEFKKTEFEQWEKTQSRWLHFQMSLGRFRDVMAKAFEEGINIGYKKGLEAKINTTTISDCPLPDGDVEKDIRIRMLSQKVYDLQKELEVLREKNRLAAEQNARDIRSRFPC